MNKYIIFIMCQLRVSVDSGVRKVNALPRRFAKIIVLQRRGYHEQNLQSDLEQNEELLCGGE